MPLPASQLDDDAYLALMVEAVSKSGKTQSIGASMVKAFGQIYIIECGTPSSLKPLQQVTRKFEYDLVRDEVQMEAAIKAARAGVKEGKYKGIFLDDFNLYGLVLHELLYRDAAGRVKGGGEPDGRPIWWEWRKRMGNTINRLLDVKAHFVMACHPSSFMGKAGEEIPGIFSDVVFMEKTSKDERKFLINADAEPGRGSRSVQGEHKIDADVGAFWKLAQDQAKAKKKASG
jgi:hypothetical protein